MISLLMFSSTAWALKHTGKYLSRDEVPLRWYMSGLCMLKASIQVPPIF